MFMSVQNQQNINNKYPQTTNLFPHGVYSKKYNKLTLRICNKNFKQKAAIADDHTQYTTTRDWKKKTKINIQIIQNQSHP